MIDFQLSVVTMADCRKRFHGYVVPTDAGGIPGEIFNLTKLHLLNLGRHRIVGYIYGEVLGLVI